MDCIDLFKKAAAAMQTDPRYLELDAARRENDNDQELQGLIGEFNLKRLDLNNESAKPEPDTAHVADLNQQVNDLYTQIMSSEGMVLGSTFSSFTLESPSALGRNGLRVANTPMRVLPPSRGGRTVGRQLVPSCPACTTVENCHTSQI